MIHDTTNETLSPLEVLMTRLKKSLMFVKIMSEPISFDILEMKDSSHWKHLAETHFITSMFWKLLDEVPRRITHWQDTCNSYFSEFGGHWKYYASAKRLELIKEFGGDDCDYDESGNLIRDGLTDKQLAPYSVFRDLYFMESRDIIQDMNLTALNELVAYIKTDARIDIVDCFRGLTDKNILPYVVDENTGTLRKQTLDEYELSKISKEVAADDISSMTVILFLCIKKMCMYIKNIITSGRDASDCNEEVSRIARNCKLIEQLDLDKVDFIDDLRNSTEMLHKIFKTDNQDGYGAGESTED